MRKAMLRLLVLITSSLPLLVQGADLTDLYDRAKRSDPQLRAAVAAREAAREGSKQSRALLYPDVRFTANVAENDEEGAPSYSSDGWTLSLTQPLYRRDRFVAVSQSDLAAKQAELEYSAAEQALIVRLSERYFDVLAAIDNLEFAQAEKKAISRQLDQTKQRFDVGLIAITDVHEAQARYDLAVAQEIVAQNSLANARIALREVTGEFTGDLQALSDKVPLITPQPADVESWGSSAVGQNPTVAAVRLSAEAAREEIRRLRAGHYPTLDLVASRNHSDVDGGSLGPRETDSTSLSLQLTVPIYQGGLVTSQTRQAEFSYQQALEGLEQQVRATDRQARNAYLGVLASISQVKALQQALVSSRSALQATEAGFEVGTRTIVDVLNAQRELFRARRDLARARYDYVLNSLRLKQAAGILKESDLLLVNSWLTASR
ncbi:MAG: efflux RND transporter outer membrane protein VpoC [Gammaproteobacteria bacterium]